MLQIKIGVPQGPVLVPLHFIIYLSYISGVSSMFSPIIYATLTRILSAFNINNNNNEPVNSEINKISDWLKLNKHSLNAS